MRAFAPGLNRIVIWLQTEATLNKLLAQAKEFAREYYRLTGKRTLGMTGKSAEYEAARILGLTLAEARSGRPLTRPTKTDSAMKSRRVICPWNGERISAAQRMSKISDNDDWDILLVVVLR